MAARATGCVTATSPPSTVHRATPAGPTSAACCTARRTTGASPSTGASWAASTCLLVLSCLSSFLSRPDHQAKQPKCLEHENDIIQNKNKQASLRLFAQFGSEASFIHSKKPYHHNRHEGNHLELFAAALF